MEDGRTRRYTLTRHAAPLPPPGRWSEGLNEQQLAAVTAPDGPVLVLAGAGSGKTRVITHRAAFLIARGVPPAQIMLATFTNKAARNMLHRVEDAVGGPARQITGGTFHHIANLLLRRHGRVLGYDPSFTILDESDSRAVMKLCRAESGIERTEKAFPSDRLLVDLASAMVNSALDLETLLSRRHPQLMELFSPIEQVLSAYATRKAASNQMDFDDLLVNFHRLLTEQPATRAALAHQYTHILVDEYQDVNHLQAGIVRELFLGERSGVGAGPVPAQDDTTTDFDLAPPIFDARAGAGPAPTQSVDPGDSDFRLPTTDSPGGRGLFVVGDDAQSIFSFRGADYESIRSFPYQFAGAGVFKLELNYRSTPEVLELANAILHEGDPVFRKELRPVKPSLELRPLLLATRDTSEQAEFVAEQLMQLREGEGYEWRQMAVLYRAHSNRLETELELNKRGIPFVVRGGLRFFEQAHIKDVVSYLVLLANGRDELAWQRVLLMAQRVGPKTAAEVIGRLRGVPADESPLTRFTLNGIADGARGQAKGSLIGLRDFMRGLEQMAHQGNPPADMLRYIVDGRYGDYLELSYDNPRQRLDDIEQLMVYAQRFTTLPALLAEVGLASGFTGAEVVNPDAGADREEGAVTLSTIHQAKGLEWRAVLLISVSDDIIPHRLALMDPLGEDEERRLLYVAVTRAEELLILSYPQLLTLRDYQRVVTRPSRFIASLPKSVYEEGVLEWG